MIDSSEACYVGAVSARSPRGSALPIAPVAPACRALPVAPCSVPVSALRVRAPCTLRVCARCALSVAPCSSAPLSPRLFRQCPAPCPSRPRLRPCTAVSCQSRLRPAPYRSRSALRLVSRVQPAHSAQAFSAAGSRIPPPLP
ncbi:unnamed protein product, partial [Closterium sp. NIES-54]